jgi:hypothetical protein
MVPTRWTEVKSLWWLIFFALFIRLIIHTFQLVFSARTVFFSHNKSANSVFQPAYQHSRTEPCFSLCSGKHEKHQERNIKDMWDEAGMLGPT